MNANGGINGRPIHYSIEDDQWNPETAAQLAAKLVNDTKVVGMVGNSSFVECAANAKFYETNNVLVIAGVGVPRDCFHSKNIAPTNGGPRMSNIGAAQYLHDDLNVKRMVCLSLNIPNVGDWSCDGIAAYGKSVGMEVKTILFDPASMDATSLILQAMAFKPDAIDFNTPKEGGIPLYAAAEQQQLGARSISLLRPRITTKVCPRRSVPTGARAGASSSSWNSSRSTSTAATLITGTRCSTSTASPAISGIRSRKPATWRLWQLRTRC